ncbi:MAG TPA: CDP-glycerol:glycerophosphate glycerophosphotransferase [Segeticoccus sp.]|nr:CDP-glycerol:glycerophosphate glycerophosphotransferase [Segeticoccus sp.]
MPLISIIVPVYDVQAYLHDCLGSVLDQDFKDFEIVAVDDRSPDHSPAMLDELAEREPRLKVLHLERNVGLGPARNAGLEVATGEYVHFLDSDDLLAPGALGVIAEKLEQSGWPEMLLLDHARSFWWGKVQQNIRADVLEDLSGEVFTAHEHPELFELLHVAWNKVCRRDFLEREELSFPPGYYEDTPWTYKAVLTARSIAALPYVCVYYRQRRYGSILGTRSRRHFEAFDQWQRVFDFLDSRPDLDEWRHILSERMAGHYLTVLRKSHRIANEDRPEFFRRASEHLVRYGSPDLSNPERRSEAVLHRLLYQGDPRLFHLLKQASRAKGRAAVAARRGAVRGRHLRTRAKTAVKLAEYRRLLHAPLWDDVVVYASLWNRTIGGNPKAVYDAMQEVAPHLHGVWIIREDARNQVPPGIDYVVPGMRRYWQLMARAKYFVNDVNFPTELVKRTGQVHVQTQHGTPLKHMGTDLMAHPAAANGMDFRKLLHRSDRWDYNVSANRYSTLVWERAFPSEFTTLESGYPRNDRLVNATADDVRAAREELGLPGGRTAVLFAPTHRDWDRHFVLRVDLPRLAKDLGDDFVLLMRTHYFYDATPELRELQDRGLVLDVSRHADVEQLMLASDLLVTDYSSIMFDYANLCRPIVVYAPDWDTYREVRGVYFDLLAEPPGAVATTQEQLAHVLVEREGERPPATVRLAEFRRRFCEFDDGHAAERVARTVFLGEPALPLVPADERPVAPRPDEVDLSGVQQHPPHATAPRVASAGGPTESVPPPGAREGEETEAAAEAAIDEEPTDH